MDKYYDPSLMSNYGVRYLLFTGVIATLAAAAIVVPALSSALPVEGERGSSRRPLRNSLPFNKTSSPFDGED